MHAEQLVDALQRGNFTCTRTAGYPKLFWNQALLQIHGMAKLLFAASKFTSKGTVDDSPYILQRIGCMNHKS